MASKKKGRSVKTFSSKAKPAKKNKKREISSDDSLIADSGVDPIIDEYEDDEYEDDLYEDDNDS